MRAFLPVECEEFSQENYFRICEWCATVQGKVSFVAAIFKEIANSETRRKAIVVALVNLSLESKMDEQCLQEVLVLQSA